MKTIFTTILSLLITGTQAMASGNGNNGESLGLMATLFIAFSILIVVFQLFPGIMLFGGMIKGLFSHENKKSSPLLAKTTGKNF
ncbi:MAG: hypothetical protein CXR30_13900 [Geobacter sp.]|nr:MAG: hypothetical protein CXR30_13900 [Geobacter sp.]